MVYRHFYLFYYWFNFASPILVWGITNHISIIYTRLYTTLISASLFTDVYERVLSYEKYPMKYLTFIIFLFLNLAYSSFFVF